ncbi:hypothetical protein [Altererythrobacter aquiaggeris]|uniref:hypothetical protein n=1 Tax=Aestuarierythrobacter aquiaggeris TaxID=1898396 RepID=UPI003018EA10
MTNPPKIAKSGVETCVGALQIWGAFFLLTAVAQIAFPGSAHTWLIVVLAGILALGAIAYRWVSNVGGRKELANSAFVAVAIFIAIDVGVALTE